MVTKEQLKEAPIVLEELFSEFLTSLADCQNHELEFYLGDQIFFIREGKLDREFCQKVGEYEDGSEAFECKKHELTKYFTKLEDIVRKKFLLHQSEIWLELEGYRGDY
jgi:hypothetical protein